jgi:hypothetical protein
MQFKNTPLASTRVSLLTNMTRMRLRQTPFPRSPMHLKRSQLTHTTSSQRQHPLVVKPVHKYRRHLRNLRTIHILHHHLVTK